MFQEKLKLHQLESPSTQLRRAPESHESKAAGYVPQALPVSALALALGSQGSWPRATIPPNASPARGRPGGAALSLALREGCLEVLHRL